MALPTAPLGQLPSMNMPYSVPTYSKGPSIWEQALASFLVNAAGQAASKGTDNVLSHENAAEFDQKPATFMSKLVSGPKVGDAEAKQMRQNTFQAGQAGKDRAFQADELDQRLQAQAGQSEADAANARIRTQMGIDADVARQDEADSARLNLAMGDRAAATDVVNMKDRLERSNPENVARTGLYGAQAAEHQANAEFYKRILSPGGPQVTSTLQGQQQSKVDPSIANFARGNGAAAPAAPSADDQIRAFLARGASPDQIVQQMSPDLTPRQQIVQTKANALGDRDAARAAEQDALVEQIKRRLNLGPIAAPFSHGRDY